MKRLTMTFGAGLLALAAGAACAQNIRIGLQEDPDVLDPHRARTYVCLLYTSPGRRAAAGCAAAGCRSSSSR